MEGILLIHISSMIVLLALYAFLLEKGAAQSQFMISRASLKIVGFYPYLSLTSIVVYKFLVVGGDVTSALVVATICTVFIVNIKAVLDRLYTIARHNAGIGDQP